MKKNIFITIAIFLITSLVSMAQEKNEIPKAKEKIRYKIDMQFTGEIRDGLDSVFNAIIIIDEQDIRGCKKAVLKKLDGDQEDLIFKGKEKKVKGFSRKDGKIYINMGEANWRVPLPAVLIEDDNGKIIEVYEGQKKKNNKE